MSADTYSIHIKVDSSEAKKAGLDLDDLSDGSIRLKLSIEKLNETTKNSSKHFSDATKSVNKMIDAYRNASGVIESGTSIASRLGMASSKTAKEIENISKSADNAKSSIGGFAKSAQALHSAFVLIIGIELARFLRETVDKTREAADAYTEMTSRLSIATESQIELNKSFRDASEISTKYYGNLTDVASAYSKINPILAAMGREQGDTEKVVSSLSASLLASGANVRDAAESFRQFSQAISGPVIQMEEMNTIIDSNQALWRGLNREFAPLVEKYGSLKNAISAQAISNQMLVEATIKLGDEFDALASKKVPTIANALTILNNKFIEYIGNADGTAGVSKDISTAIVDLAENLDKVLDPFMKVASGLGTAATGAGRLLANLGPLAEMIGSVAGVIAKDLGEIATRAADAGDALSALAGNIEDYKDVYEVNRAKGSDKVLEGINSEISETKKLLDLNKELQSRGNMSVAQEVENYERKLKKLNELKEAHFQQADAQKKAEREEMERIDERRKREAATPSAKVDEKALKRSRDEAERNFSAILDFQLAQAENAEKIFEAQSKTKLEQIESEKKAIRDAAEVEIEAATTKEERLAVYLKMQQQLEEKILQETGLRQELLQHDVNLNQARIDSANQLLARSNEYQFSQAEILRIQKEIAAAQTQIDIAPEEAKQLEIDATEKLRSSAEEYNKELAKSADTQKDVREEALRTLAVLESNLDFAKEMATGFSDAFGEMGEAIGGLVVSLAEYEKQMATIKIQMEEEIAKNPGKRYEIEQKAAEKSAKTQINAYGDMASSAQKFFKKGTAGYDGLGAAVKVFRAFEMAQSAMSMVKQLGDMGAILAQFLGMETAKTATKIASNSAQQASDAAGAATSATKAVADAGQGDPYTGIVRAAAMLAFMAAIGIAVGGGGGGGSTASAPPPKAGTGTVLGDPTAQSESLGNALEQLVNINSNDLAYSAGMLESLRNIESSLANAAALVARQVMPLISGVMSKFDKTGAMTSSKVTEAGLVVLDKSLQKVLSSGTLGGVMGFRAESESTGGIKSATQQFTAYGKKLSEEFGKIVLNVYDSIVEGGKAIGITSDVISERVKDYVISVGKINIAGMSSEEAAKEIEAAFSSMSDSMAMKLLPEFKDFQKSGEGYFETMVRVGSGVADATGKLEQLGMTAIDYSQIVDKQKDVSAEIARQTLMAQGDLGSGAVSYVKQLTGSIEDIISAYQQLKDAQNSLRTIGVDPNNLTRAMINAAGGLSKFQESITTFIDEFMTPADKVRGQGAALNEQFTRIGVSMPKTRDAFRDLILSLDTTTESGQKTYGQLIALSPAFAEYIAGFEDLSVSMDDFFSKIKDFRSSIASEIASLTSTSAVAALSVTSLQDAYRALFSSIGYMGENAQGTDAEVELLGNVKQAIMSRYNAELAVIREASQAQAQAIKETAAIQVQAIKDSSSAQQEAIKAQSEAQIKAINEQVDAQVDAINAQLEAQIDAINEHLDAEVEAKQKAHEAALDALQNELEAANKLKSAVEQVRNYARGMALGPNAPLSPEQALTEAQRQYEDLLRRAQGGDAEAISQLSGAADQYLEQAKRYYGSGTQYSNMFDGVKKAMEAIGAMDVTDPDSIQSRIDLLRESQQKEIEDLRKVAQDQIEQLRDSTKDQIEQIKKSASDQIDQIKKSTNDQIDQIKKSAEDQINALNDAANKQIQDLTDPEKNLAIKKLKDDTIAELKELAEISTMVETAAKLQRDAQTEYLRQIASNTSNTSVTDPIDTRAFNQSQSSSDSELNTTMNTVAVETRALVNAQTAANPQIIQNLANVDARLAKIERNLKLSA